jgi:hypothetical protein|tara:strand:+ start:7308 stop:7526 length:219 start_codon:yes stop_codon:yes gene_type:complete
MKRKKPSIYSLIPWSFAACGLLIALGNLFGLTGLQLPIFPVVQDAVGLIINAVFLLAIGFIPVVITHLFQKA